MSENRPVTGAREIPMEGVERYYAEEIFDAVSAARDQGELTWLTENDVRVAAIVPVPAGELAGTMPAFRELFRAAGLGGVTL